MGDKEQEEEMRGGLKREVEQGNHEGPATDVSLDQCKVLSCNRCKKVIKIGDTSNVILRKNRLH